MFCFLYLYANNNTFVVIFFIDVICVHIEQVHSKLGYLNVLAYELCLIVV